MDCGCARVGKICLCLIERNDGKDVDTWMKALAKAKARETKAAAAALKAETAMEKAIDREAALARKWVDLQEEVTDLEEHVSRAKRAESKGERYPFKR
jgi:uncharacterized protein YicC (UPF0701 family)